MPKIMAIPNGMRNMAKDIYIGADKLNNDRRNMERLLMDLGKYFSGKVPALLLERVILMEKTYIKFAEELRKYGDRLILMANEYEKADEEGAKKFNEIIMSNKTASSLLKLNMSSNN